MARPFGQAIYGERDRGHRLLAASTSFPEPETLAGRMDMQGSPPPHTDWQPYISGFAWNRYYIFARTMPDPQGTRAGMVFSRAIAMTAEQVAAVDDVLGVLELLAALGDARDDIEDVMWRPASGSLTASTGLVQALLADAPEPVVWPGQSGFDSALAQLWRALWPAARLSLSFRIAFSPMDVAADPPTIVTTPTALLSRWSGFKTVRLDASPQSADVAEQYLIEGERSPNLSMAVEAFGQRSPRIGELRRLAEMGGLIQDGGTFADYIDALRLACHLGPAKEDGEAIKRQLIEQVVKAVPQASGAEVRMARNLDLSAAAASPDFWEALSEWARRRLWLERDAAMIATLVEDAIGGKPSEWRKAVGKGMRKALTRPARTTVEAIWRALASRPAILTAIELADDASALEAALVEYAPAKLKPAVAAALATEALGHRLVALQAVCLASSLPPVEAIRRHIAEAPFNERSLAIVARKATGRDLVTASIEHDDDLTLSLAAKACAETPSLLRKLDVTSARWRSLWAEALRRNQNAAEGPARPEVAMATLLDGVAAGSISDGPLLAALARTPLGDLSRFPNREAIWPRLAHPVLHNFLNATADGWITALESGDELAVDDTLADVIVEPHRLDPALARLTSNLVGGCQLFRALPQLGERRLRAWLDAALRRGTGLAPSEAQALGRLIAARDWTDAAGSVADAIIHQGRQDLRPAVDYVVELIGMVRRYFLDETGNSTPTSAKWDILEEIALELYGYGPGKDSLWQRAGGKERDIPKTNTGAEAWRKVLGEAERGRGDIDVAALIHVMAEDYPNNRVLQKLRRDSAFRTRIGR